MFYRLGTLIIKELIQMMRAKALVLMVIFGPLAEMSLVAWSTSAPITNLPTVVVDQSRSEANGFQRRSDPVPGIQPRWDVPG